ncbi:hypothetical protein CEXT_770091 [Caerostris extrusa]|uniref:Uncharacterized protein n=1 Tax=Caerostris extrusa TaxID=172846 RepID=A0AAV4Y4B5_CAEEX|nr:hypothetical protein CEXT_770091 [Caerostris extrusa]
MAQNGDRARGLGEGLALFLFSGDDDADDRLARQKEEDPACHGQVSAHFNRQQPPTLIFSRHFKVYFAPPQF